MKKPGAYNTRFLHYYSTLIVTLIDPFKGTQSLVEAVPFSPELPQSESPRPFALPGAEVAGLGFRV